MLDSQWIDGSSLSAAALALAGGKAWIAGATQLADVPITPGAATPAGLAPGRLPGAFLAAADFGAAAPAIRVGCVLDGANLTHASAVAPNQILTVFGTGIGGATVTFDGNPATTLYSSASQWNVVVPATSSQNTILQVAGNGVQIDRQLPVVRANPNLFADRPAATVNCVGATQGIALVASNEDGTRNSCDHPAKAGSVVSVYVEGLGNPPVYVFDALLGTLSVAVEAVSAVSDFVTRVDLRLPDSLDTATAIRNYPLPVIGSLPLSLRVASAVAGPILPPTGNIVNVAGALTIYATP